MAHLVSRSVVVVEDEYLLASEIAEAVEIGGGTVCGLCSTIKEAFRLLETRIPDIAILNVRVRDGETYVLATMLRERGIPIVFVTGEPRPPNTPDLQTAPWITKPYDLDQLIDALAIAVESAKVTRESSARA